MNVGIVVCDVLAVKYNLGRRTREGYKSKNGGTRYALNVENCLQDGRIEWFLI